MGTPIGPKVGDANGLEVRAALGDLVGPTDGKVYGAAEGTPEVS